MLKNSIGNLTKTKSIQKEELPDISKIIKLDSSVINFGKFVSGKMLGSTLLVQNESK